jgi:hypothetical protein
MKFVLTEKGHDFLSHLNEDNRPILGGSMNADIYICSILSVLDFEEDGASLEEIRQNLKDDIKARGRYGQYLTLSIADGLVSIET